MEYKGLEAPPQAAEVEMTTAGKAAAKAAELEDVFGGGGEAPPPVSAPNPMVSAPDPNYLDPALAAEMQ